MGRIIRATVKVTWVNGRGEREQLQREKHFRPGTPKRKITAWKAHARSLLERRLKFVRERGKATTGTLAKDAERYYPLTRHMAEWHHRRSEISAWIQKLGERERHTIDRADVLRVRGEWLAEGKAPKTINNRVTALRQLYRALDGDDAPNPCEGVKPLPTHRTPPQVVTAAIVNQVLENLAARAQETKQGRPTPHAAQDRARLMVLASTGKRPSELARAQPGDVDLTRRVWAVRDGKGGWSEGMYLNDEMLAAWQAFVDANAWGTIPAHFSRRLRDAGWPKGIRPYNLRHSTWITASERGADLADIQAGAGHKNIATTRLHYVPVLNSRMQKLSERLEGRFGWQPRLADQQKQGETS